jgi:hypothetical protein
MGHTLGGFKKPQVSEATMSVPTQLAQRPGLWGKLQLEGLIYASTATSGYAEDTTALKPVSRTLRLLPCPQLASRDAPVRFYGSDRPCCRLKPLR